jgi:hypothetical protein
MESAAPMDREFRDIQRALAKFRKRRTTRYPPLLRERITVWVAARRRRGDWWCDIARPLGIPEQTLVRWAEPRADETTAMLPVDVIDASPIGTVTLVSPCGLRIEGVAIADAIAILRGLA